MSTPTAQLHTIGILGAGRVGTAVARQALQAGLEVNIATATPAHEISMIVDIVTPGAHAVDATQLTACDLIVVAIPLHKYRTLNPELLAGKTAIDVMNYWAPIDGTIANFENDPRTSSEVLQEFLSDTHLVKTLNHIGYHELEEDGKPAGTPGRRALALASDHTAAKQLVTMFIERLGYDPVDAGPLAAGAAFAPGTQIFNGSHTAPQLQTLLEAALRPAHT